jgi:hypothetical protein
VIQEIANGTVIALSLGVSQHGHQVHSKEKSYEHPVVLITGVLTGIGRATALAFAHEGAIKVSRKSQ